MSSRRELLPAVSAFDMCDELRRRGKLDFRLHEGQTRSDLSQDVTLWGDGLLMVMAILELEKRVARQRD